jgi:hypothetical protein
MEGPLSGMLKTMMGGKYTYLTYLMCSSACFYFWMMPNHHKLRLIRPLSKDGRSRRRLVPEVYFSENNSIFIKQGRRVIKIHESPDDIEMEF